MQAAVLASTYKTSHLTPRSKMMPRTVHLLLLTYLILLHAGDIEVNPGPSICNANDESTFACNICCGNVSWSVDAVQCDGCNQWLHRDCLDMSETEYSRLGHANSAWFCCKCGLRNISTSLFTQQSCNSMEQHDYISSKNLLYASDSGSSPGMPIHQSTPTRKSRQTVSPYPAAEDIEINVAGVRKLIQRLNVHKAAGPDRIGPQVLKNLACVVAPILTVIFRKSYETGCIPDDWISAYVTPAFKKGKNCDPSNYRPISLTCVACKLMEHIITSHIMHHANRFNMLYDLQHSFRDRRSCETQILEFQADILQTFKRGLQSDVIIMDLSKAFDKVDIGILQNNWTSMAYVAKPSSG